MSLVQLDEAASNLAGRLSGGMKQRLSLTCSLMHDPKLLFLDEPTAGVDPLLRRIFWQYFKELNSRGITIFVNTHYMDEAMRCDRIGVMRRGRIISIDTPTNIKRRAVGGDLLHIVVSDPDDAKRLLDSLNLVKRAVQRDHDIEVLVEEAASAIPMISSALESAGVKVEKIVPEEITLEDALIRLIEKGGVN